MKTSNNSLNQKKVVFFKAFFILIVLLSLLVNPFQRRVLAAVQNCVTSSPVSGAYAVTPCVTVPASGAMVSGLQTVSAVVTVTGTNPGISKLIFYLDGEYLLTDFQSPFTFTLPTSKWVDGGKSLTVEALMRDGFSSQRSAISLVFNNGISQPPVNNNTFTPTSGSAPASGQPFVLAATGDGAGGMTQADSVTRTINSWNPNLFLYLGDVYEKGTSTEFYNWYGTSDTYFGQFRSVTNPIIGNHEYERGVAPGYFDYWDNVPNYYSYDAAGWHFIALNSNCGLLQNCAPGQAQYQWLLNDLNTHSNTCTVAYFHHPVYNVGPQGSTSTMNDIWALLAQKGVDIVLAGHDHNYQRWVPLNGSGLPSPSGITQFVAGGGGHGIQNFATTDSRLAVGFDTSPNSMGALRFQLNQYGASFQYINYLGDVLDSGAIPCSGAPTDSAAPGAPTNLTAVASSSTQVDLSWSASSDNVGVAGYDVYRNGSLLASLGVVTSYHDANLTQGAVYNYQVQARDAAGNVSGFSNTATVTMPALLFSDGFESGNFSSWTSNANLLIQQQDIYAGLYAARQSSSGSGASYASKTLSPTQSDLFYRLRFKVISKGSTSAYLQRFRTNSNGAIGGLFLSSTNRLSFRNDVASNSNTSGPLVTLGVWHELQTHLLINGTSSQIEVWYDGELIPALSVTGNLGTNPIGRVHLGDSSTSNIYNIALDEVGVNTSFIEVDDTQPPSVPTGLSATANAPHIVNLTWNPSSDDVEVAGYEIYRNGSLLASIGAATSYTDTPVSPSFTYNYQVQARDLVGNLSARSTVASATTPADTTPPIVTLTSPTDGASVYGMVTLSANATDNAAIGHVDFLVNGQVVGTVEELPYAVNWDSTTVPDGTVTIAARAVDIGSNPSTESSHTIFVNNSVTPTPTWTPTPANTPTPQGPVSVCLPATQDTFIVQDKPQQVHGADLELKIKSDIGFERRLLIGFDLSSVPPTYSVVDARLRLYEMTSTSGQTVSLYRLTNNWVESQMNWNYRDSVNRWITAGGDFNPTAVASFVPNLANQYREINVTSLAQNWVNGTFGNYGLLLRSSGSSGEVKFASREALITTQRPELCLTYQQTPIVTSTPMATATPTLTPGGPSATPTAASTNSPTSTPTSQPPSLVCMGPTQDSYIVQDSATQNFGSQTDLRTRTNSGRERRTLIGFNLPSLPPSSTIVSSTLRLYETTTQIGQTITLYRLTNSWVGSQVTWNQRSNGTPWTTAGGDYQNTALATFSPDIANQYRDIDVTAVTKGWANGTYSNYGLLLRGSGTNGEVRFASNEAVTATQRPQLCIAYQLPATVTPTFTATIPVTPSSTPTQTPTSAPTSTSTNTPTTSPTPTLGNTPTATASPTQTATPSITPTFTATFTATPVGSGNTFTFGPAADAYVNEASASTNYGSATTLRADASPVVRSYLRFNVQGLSGTVTRATLRIYTGSSSSAGYEVRGVSENSWGEFSINYTNAPAVGGVTATSGSFGSGAWTAVDVTPLINSNGLISFALTTIGNTAFSLSSRESGANAPQLVIETQFISTATPTHTPTITPTQTLGPSPTPTDTPTATPSFTPTPIPSDTPTPTTTPPFNVFTFTPVADTYANEGSPTSNYGTSTSLRADASPLVRSYLRFNIQGLSGSITSVTLRIFTNSASSVGYEVRNVADNSWSEGTLNHTNAPAMDGVSGTSGAFGAGIWTTVDITSLVTGNGPYNLGLTTTSGTAFSLASRESGANAPQLVIETVP